MKRLLTSALFMPVILISREFANSIGLCLFAHCLPPGLAIERTSAIKPF